MPSLFPMPLTPFEYYYWCDDRPDYPTTFPVELTFSGVLEHEAFCRALATVVARHPLLAARVQQDGRAGPQWVAGDGQPPALDWADGDVPIGAPQGEYIDLSRGPGLRVWVRQAEPTSASCCNSITCARRRSRGGPRGRRSLLAYHLYAAGCDPASVFKPLEPQRLRGAGTLARGGLSVPVRRPVGRGPRLGPPAEPIAGAAGRAARGWPRRAALPPLGFA